MPMIIDGTNGGFFPSWTTATRPASPAVGQMGYNTTTGAFDAYTAAGWASVATSATAPVNGPAFSAYLNVTQNVTTATYTKVNLDVEEFDTNSNFASGRFTPTVAGYYQIIGSVYSVATSLAYIQSAIYKNGLNIRNTLTAAQTATNATAPVSAIIYMNGSTDYLELYGSSGGGTANQFGAGITNTFFTGALIRAA